ncbi:MAG: hypothetical protein OXO54_06220 [Chloroflexota bacterium]|nr:hypothetical protein [Chloroflexota bacterium]MDE2897896.1 hypothetical protein [Chloroflexota bacterium]
MDKQTPREQPHSALAFFLNLHAATPTMVGLTMRYELEGDVWVGVCEELGTSTYDPELEAVMHELGELVLHELNALEADGEREGVFGRYGIETLPVPANVLGRIRDFNVPISPTENKQPGTQAWTPQDQLAPALTPAHS